MKLISSGFNDPVHDSQKSFRILLSALSSPAKTFLLESLPPMPDSASLFSAGMAAVALTLCDSHTPIWLQPEIDTETLRHYLRFHCSATFVSQPDKAAFAFIAKVESMPALGAFAQGTALYPEQSTTLIIETSFSRNLQALQAKGPGIGGQEGDIRNFACQQMPASFWHAWHDNHKAFPLGVDMLLLDSNSENNTAALMGFTRTTSVFSHCAQQEGIV